jgi:glycosyltransferase involved in cell wall biosynthesis
MLSVIVPCFNEEAGIAECHRRLSAVLAGIGAPYEIVYVNDGSRDGTYAALTALHRQDAHAVLVQLSRNFGHQIAVSAGLDVAKGDAVVILDADLQDPPEVIPQMYALWVQGMHVVYGLRTHRDGESGFKLWTAKLFYRVMNRLSDVQIPLDTGDFRLMDRRVVDVLLQMPERHRLLRAMCSWVGFRQTGLHYERAARFAGKTKYPLGKMMNLALDGIFSFSTVPLRMLTLLGFAAAALSFVGILWALGVRILTRHWVAGWATLFVVILLLSGLQMISLGVIGEYVGRVYTEVKQRPLFIVASILRAGEPSPMREHSAQGQSLPAVWPPEDDQPRS